MTPKYTIGQRVYLPPTKPDASPPIYEIRAVVCERVKGNQMPTQYVVWSETRGHKAICTEDYILGPADLSLTASLDSDNVTVGNNEGATDEQK